MTEYGISADKESRPTAQNPVLRGKFWFLDLKSIKFVTLKVTYWPDKTDETGFAELTLKEDVNESTET